MRVSTMPYCGMKCKEDMFICDCAMQVNEQDQPQNKFQGMT